MNSPITSQRSSFGARFSLRTLFAVMTVVVFVAVVVGAWAVRNVVRSPGGLPPTYAPVDGDALLTREARSAIPLIRAIAEYQRTNASYPSEWEELRSLLPTSTIISGPTADGWHYYRWSEPAGYVLSRKLGWDPTLKYSWNGAAGSWVFVPGDGSPDKPLVLTP